MKARTAGLQLAASLILLLATPARADTPQLRVCADPNNLPFSNQDQQGFENKLAQLVAEQHHEAVAYTWWAQRRGFVRETLKAGKCDVIIGVPQRLDMVETTRPYYRSRYVFVSCADRDLDVTTLTDPLLAHLRIGVQLIGNDGFNTPPAHALGEQGIVDNVVGFPVYGDYREPSPAARIITAVEEKEIDIAAAWGPLAGYFAKISPVPLKIMPIEDTQHFAPLRFEYAISMGVRKGDNAMRDRLNVIIEQHQPEIDALLKDYGVPLTAAAPEDSRVSAR